MRLSTGKFLFWPEGIRLHLLMLSISLFTFPALRKFKKEGANNTGRSVRVQISSKYSGKSQCFYREFGKFSFHSVTLKGKIRIRNVWGVNDKVDKLIGLLGYFMVLILLQL